MRSYGLTLVIAGMLAATSALYSQSTYATVTGVVTDATGAVLPNVAVEGVEANSGYRYTTQSNGDGLYTLPQLREGNYRIRVSHPGLSDWVAEGIELKSRDVRRLDVTLTVAAVDTRIEVTAGAG